MGDRMIIVPDTNVLLHSLLLDQIPWCELAKCDAVEIVLVAQVLRELDQKKHGDSEKLKRRAQRILSAVSAWAPSVSVVSEIRKNVSLRVSVKEPAPFPGLDLAVPDDRIIASTLELRILGPVLVVTGDITMGYKAQAHDLPVLSVPEDYRVQEESRATKAVSVPKPCLVAGLFGQGDAPRSSIEVRPGLSASHLKPDAEIGMRGARRAAEELARKVAEDARREEELQRSAFGRFGGVSRTRSWAGIEVPGTSNPATSEPSVESWESYLEAIRTYDVRYARAFPLTLGVANDGEAPADDVRVEFVFPEHVAVTYVQPRLPSRPKVTRLSDHMMIAPRVSPPLSPREPEETFVIDERRSIVRVTVRRLMHSKTFRREIWIDAQQVIGGGFEVIGRVLSASPPSRDEAKLNIRFQ